MKIVRFLQSMSPYQAGEIAGFAPEEADRLITFGFAKAWDWNQDVVEEEVVEEEDKSLDEPPVDKMISKSKKKAPEGV